MLSQRSHFLFFNFSPSCNFADNFVYFESRLSALENECVEALMGQGFSRANIACEPFLHLRYQGTDCALMVTPLKEKMQGRQKSYCYVDFQSAFLERWVLFWFVFYFFIFFIISFPNVIVSSMCTCWYFRGCYNFYYLYHRQYQWYSFIFHFYETCISIVLNYLKVQERVWICNRWSRHSCGWHQSPWGWEVSNINRRHITASYRGTTVGNSKLWYFFSSFPLSFLGLIWYE